MEENSADEKEKQKFKFIDDINESEIDEALSSYELATNITLFPSVIGIGGGGLAILGGAGLYGLAGLGSYLGFGTFTAVSTIGISTGGIGLALMGVGVGFAFLLNHFDKKSSEKHSDKEDMKNFEDKLKDPNSKEREFYNNFSKDLNEYLNKKIVLLIKSEHDELMEVARKIELLPQNLVNVLAKKLLKKVRERISKFHELDKFSILVLGKSGVGKTTLINAILDQEQKGTTIGLPMTMENPQIKHCNRKLFPALDIWDSRGLELDKEFNIENNSKQVIDFIRKGIKKEENFDKSVNFIHCIWYCVTGSRIEKGELEYIKKLKKIYSSDKQLPIIFVYTQATNDAFIKGIKDTIIKELKDPDIKFIEVISNEIPFKMGKTTYMTQKKGLKKLMKQSVELAKNGFESAFFGNIVKEYENLIQYFLSDKPNLEFFKNVQNKVYSKLKEKVYSTKIFEQYPELLCESFIHIYKDDKTYEDNVEKNKSLFEPMKEKFRTWYKQKFTEFSDIITENELLKFIDEPLNKVYKEAFKNKLSKIPDFDLLSKFEKDSHNKEIKNLLEPEKKQLKNYFNGLIKNYVEHKKALGTSFVIEYLTKEFLKEISERTKKQINIATKIVKNEIDSEVQNAAKLIYDNLSKGVNIDLIPKCDDDDEIENEIIDENGQINK